jgi:acyl-coenzyme A thioesterase 13
VTEIEGFDKLDDDGFNQHIGPLFVRKNGDGLEFRMPVRAEHLNGGGVVHGGMMMTFADIILQKTAENSAPGKKVTSVSLNSDFCSFGPSDCTLKGIGTITRQTRTIQFLSGEIRLGDKILMTMTGVWKILGD